MKDSKTLKAQLKEAGIGAPLPLTLESLQAVARALPEEAPAEVDFYVGRETFKKLLAEVANPPTLHGLQLLNIVAPGRLIHIVPDANCPEGKVFPAVRWLW